jgi:hypothetical protein
MRTHDQTPHNLLSLSGTFERRYHGCSLGFKPRLPERDRLLRQATRRGLLIALKGISN